MKPQRHAQRLRSEARCASRLLRGLADVRGYRGGELGKFGRALLASVEAAFGHDVRQEVCQESVPAPTQGLAAVLLPPLAQGSRMACIVVSITTAYLGEID